MTKPCAFCEIVAATDRATVVLEDELTLAFLDRRPLFPGHCLLVPKAHYATLPDLPVSMIGPLFENAQRLARALVEGLGADGSFVAVNNGVSQSVPHMHVHVVPRRKNDGLRGFFWPRHPYADEEEKKRIQERLVRALRPVVGPARTA